MSFMKETVSKSLRVWDECVKSDFISELKKGTLPLEKFKNYMVQDLGVGAMFSTSTKTDADVVSMQTLLHIRKSVRIPIVVIGGIKKENAPMFKSAGVDGLAVVSGIISQPDIRASAQDLKKSFLGGKRNGL